MSTKNLRPCSLILAAVMLCTGAICFADTVRLKNGSVIKGKVVTYNQMEFTIVLDLGASSRRSTSRMVIAAEDIESIEFDAAGSGGQAYNSMSTIGPSGPELSGRRGESQPPARNDEAPALDRETGREPSGGASHSTDTSQILTTSGTEPLVIAEKNISVASAADWTSTEIRVKRGQRISITASGEVDLGSNQRSNPDGISLNDSRKLIPARPTGALIAVVGDDNDDFVYVGRASEFTATHNGILFLSVNEGNLKDNSGSFLARVKVMGAK